MTFVDGARIAKTPQLRRLVLASSRTCYPDNYCRARALSVSRMQNFAGRSMPGARFSKLPNIFVRISLSSLRFFFSKIGPLYSWHPADMDRKRNRGSPRHAEFLSVDRQQRRRGYISTQRLPSWKRSSASPETSGGCVELEWCGPGVVLLTLNELNTKSCCRRESAQRCVLVWKFII